MNKVLYFNLLFTYYKELLTQKEQDIFSLYYEENLTMNEIAQLKNISKSAVGFKIKSVEKKLIDYEKVIKKYDIIQKIERIIKLENIDEIKKDLKKIVEIIWGVIWRSTL